MESELPIVIDLGSCFIKAGFAGDDASRVIIESIIGADTRTNVTSATMQNYFGTELHENRMLVVSYPIEHGLIKKSNEMVDILTHISNVLKVQLDGSSVFFSETSVDTQSNKDKLTKLMFEETEVANICIGDGSKLALHALNIDTGIVFECGHGVTQIVPVLNGSIISDGICRSDYSGNDLTLHLIDRLRERNHIVTQDKYHARLIKEQFCRIKYDEERKQLNVDDTKKSITPYMSSVKYFYDVTGREISECGENLFQPVLGFNHKGVHNMLIDTINRCDMDGQLGMKQNILLCGGTTMMSGFKERMTGELSEKQIDVDMKFPQNRNYINFVGGSKFASSPHMQQLWVTKKDFDEAGVSIIYRKWS